MRTEHLQCLRRQLNGDLKKMAILEVCIRKKLLSKTQTERNACHGVEKKDGGMYKTSGLK